MIVVVVVVLLSVVAAAHWYLWRRLFRDTTTATPRGRRVRRFGALALSALGLLMVAALAGGLLLPRRFETVVAWPGYLWVAVLFYLTLALAVLELPAALA